MTSCQEVHAWACSLAEFRFPFERASIPQNGLYVLFEKGETAHGGKRIVRIGTHTGEGQLFSRLKQHFLVPNKDRSIFRKNIGRAILSRDKDDFLSDWEIDLTTRAARTLHGTRIDLTRQKEIENLVTTYIQNNFSFATVPVKHASERHLLESRLISTISLCADCVPSAAWLGNFSPKQKICESGLWLVNELYKEPLSAAEFMALRNAVL